MTARTITSLALAALLTACAAAVPSGRLVTIDAGRSEFSFNGVSYGAIAHGSGAGGRIGSIRIERFDRPGVEGDTIRFDDLSIGTIDLDWFKRGDANGTGALDIADAIFILSYLFARGAVPACLDTADPNDSGEVDVADAIKLLSHLFGKAGPLPAPFGECGADPSDDGLTCDSYPPCE